jgi:hypothetical protein
MTACANLSCNGKVSSFDPPGTRLCPACLRTKVKLKPRYESWNEWMVHAYRKDW